MLSYAGASAHDHVEVRCPVVLYSFHADHALR